MKLIIAGSRFDDIKDPDTRQLFCNDAVRQGILLHIQFPLIKEIVSGHCRGIDLGGEFYAKEKGIPVKIFKADWDKYGKSAGPMRNKLMAEYSDVLLAVWDGKSRGTKNMIDEMRKLNKPVYIYKPDYDGN
jgi:hypothetical protein